MKKKQEIVNDEEIDEHKHDSDETRKLGACTYALILSKFMHMYTMTDQHMSSSTRLLNKALSSAEQIDR